MKNLTKKLALALALIPSLTQAQTATGPTYCLPKTGVRLTLLIEKTSYEPGDYAQYAARYLKRNDVETQASDNFRILNVRIEPFALPDPAKTYTAVVDGKNNVKDLHLDESNMLLAVNAQPKPKPQSQSFKPARKPARINPRDFMSEEILTAGSTAKMAELTALEIFDIRESRSLLSRGQADFMPNDGAQMQLMLDKLDMQEQALLQLFTGTSTTDTLETSLTFVPEAETERQLLFRFSKKLGMVDADDLSGRPFYVSVEDLHQQPQQVGKPDGEGKRDKEDPNICVNVPGKIRLQLFDGIQTLAQYELQAAQFGHVERLGTAMFNKKLLTRLVLNPINGSVESLQTEAVK